MTQTAPPRISLDELEPRTEYSPLEPDFLGYTLSSWQRLIQKKGPVLLAEIAGKEQLILCNHETDRRAWKAPEDWLYGPPTSSGNFFNREMGNTHITQQDGAVHRRSRKLLLPGFGIGSLGRDIDAIAAALALGLEGLNNNTNNLHTALCAIYTTALSRSQVKVDLDRAMIGDLVEFEEQFISGLQLSAQDQERWHTRPDYLALKGRVFALFERIGQQRLQANGVVQPDDTLQNLLSAPHKKNDSELQPLKPEELNNVIYLLLLAGVGNIAVLACCMLWSLNQRPEWHEQLVAELKDFEPQQIKRGLKQFPKLQATIFETERRYLPAPIVPKVTTRDVDVLGFHVPANTHVLQMIGLSHFDEERYPNAQAFAPERWLEDGTARANAYGGGTHLCLGMGVSRALLPLTLALLVQNHSVQKISKPETVAVDSSIDYSPTTLQMNVALGTL